MPTGRPTKYSPEITEAMLEYFDIEAGQDVEVENSKGVMVSVRHAADLPTLTGFARKMKLTRDTLHRWATTMDDEGNPIHPEFSDAYKIAKHCQEDILIQNGLKGGYNASFAIFTAKNILGWRDQPEQGDSEPAASLSISFEVSAPIGPVKTTIGKAKS